MDTKDISNSPIEPAGDSRPIKFEALLEHEVELIRRANGLLRGMYRDAKQSQNSLRDPWAAVDHNRRYRTLMISGPRGSGKTSMLLTLLAGWRSAWTEEWDAITDSKNPEHRAKAEDLFRPMAGIVRPLKPLDFDPLPPELPLYGWIIQAFLPLVEWLEKDGQGIWDTKLDRDIRDTERGRDRLPWSHRPRSLREQWQELYQAAIVGWGTGKLREAFQKDLYDLILDQGAQHLNWQKLQDSWESFLDDLFKELDQRANVFPKSGLLVLPIDDADLQIERDRELIFAVRLLRHPRVAYLLTGYIDHLRDNLELDFLGRMMTLSRSNEEQVVDESKVRSRGLAHDLVKKVLPVSHVLDMPVLSLRGVLEWSQKEQNELFDNISLKKGVSFRQFIENRPSDLDEKYLLLRELQQFKDQIANAQDLSDALLLAEFLEILSTREDPDEFRVGRKSKEQIVLHTHPGPIIPVAQVYQSVRPSPQVELRVGVGIETKFKQVRPSIIPEMPEFVDASPLTLLALDLTVEAPYVYVHQHAPRVHPPQCLVWSIWHSAAYVIWIPWPSIEANSPTVTVRRVEDWTQDVRNIDYTGDNEWVNRIAFTWIRHHLLWLGADRGQLPDPLEADSDMTDVWHDLFEAFKSLQNSVRDAPWFQQGLPLLTAPEYGLSKNLRENLLLALRVEQQAAQELPQKWQEFRRKSINAAKMFTQEHAPVDWFEVNPYDPEIAISEVALERLLDAIKNTSSDSPWCQEPHRSSEDVK